MSWGEGIVGTHSVGVRPMLKPSSPESVVRLENGAERPVGAAPECFWGAFIDRCA